MARSYVTAQALYSRSKDGRKADIKSQRLLIQRTLLAACRSYDPDSSYTSFTEPALRQKCPHSSKWIAIWLQHYQHFYYSQLVQPWQAKLDRYTGQTQPREDSQ